MAKYGTFVDELMAGLNALAQFDVAGAEPSAQAGDIPLDLTFPRADITLQVNLRRSGVIDRDEARRLPEPEPGSHPILIAPFVSQAVRDELRSSGWSYWDPTGNMLIQSEKPFVWIDRLGAKRNPAPDPFTGPQRLRSLKGKAVALVVVKLLEHGRAASVRELARQAEVGAATVSRVVEFLRDEDLLSDTRGGPIVVSDRSRLARRWAEDYSFARTFKAKRYYSVLGDQVALQRLRGDGRPYAITGVRAANDFLGEGGRVGSLPSHELWLYAPDRHQAERTLDLVPDPRGSILVGEADFVTDTRGFRTNAGLRYVWPWRVVGDLLSSAGRTASVGEDLMDELLNAPLGVRV